MLFRYLDYKQEVKYEGDDVELNPYASWYDRVQDEHIKEVLTSNYVTINDAGPEKVSRKIGDLPSFKYSGVDLFIKPDKIVPYSIFKINSLYLENTPDSAEDENIITSYQSSFDKIYEKGNRLSSKVYYCLPTFEAFKQSKEFKLTNKYKVNMVSVFNECCSCLESLDYSTDVVLDVNFIFFPFNVHDV